MAKLNGGIGRRKILKSAGVVAGAALGSTVGAPLIWAQNNKNIVLRQFGTGVSAINEIAEKAKKDLGFTIQMTALDSDACVQRAVTQPNSYDVADIEYWMIKKIWPSKVLQPFDVKKLTYFDKIVPIFTTGKLKPDSVIAQGTAPSKVGFVDTIDSTTFSKGQTGWFTMVPTIYNADTLGIRPDLVGREISQWKDILDPKFKGKTSILNIPSIGIMDAAMICESAGIIKYGDKGNMTKAEIDKTIDFLIKMKKEGQFRAFWKTFDESVNLMTSGEVVIQSMWSPAVAYDYINWYLSGWVGGFLNRQGYYSAVLETAKANMSEDEWGFWMEGKPAKGDIKSPQGAVMEKAGTVRDGGSFYERMGAVACWNAVMDEDRYMVQKWNSFIAA